MIIFISECVTTFSSSPCKFEWLRGIQKVLRVIITDIFFLRCFRPE